MIVKFSDVFSDETKHCQKIPSSEYLPEGSFPIIDQGKEQVAGYSNAGEGLFTEVPAIIFGDHTRIIKYVDEPFLVGADGVKVLKCKIEDTNYKYLYYCLQAIRIPNTGYNRHFKWLKEASVPLPPLDEQRKIAAVLDKVSDLIAKRRQQLDKLDEMVKARFVEMFGTLQDPKSNLPVVSIDSVCSLIKDGTHQTPKYTDDAENGFKFLSSKDVMTQRISWDNIKYIPAELHEKLYAVIQPKRNDILMSKNGVNYGVAAVNDSDEIFDIYVSLALLRPTSKINPVYLRCAINNPDTKRQFDSSIKGIGVPNLHLSEIKKTKILLPSLSMQNQFAAFVEQTEKTKTNISRSLEKLETLKKALMQEYFG